MSGASSKSFLVSICVILIAGVLSTTLNVLSSITPVQNLVTDSLIGQIRQDSDVYNLLTVDIIQAPLVYKIFETYDAQVKIVIDDVELPMEDYKLLLTKYSNIYFTNEIDESNGTTIIFTNTIKTGIQ